MLKPRGRWQSPSGREGRGGGSGGATLCRALLLGRWVSLQARLLLLPEAAVPGGGCHPPANEKEQGDPSQEGTGSERSGVFAGERVSPPATGPCVPAPRPALRSSAASHAEARLFKQSESSPLPYKQRLRLGWGQDLGTLSSRPVSAPVCCPLTSKGTQVALFMALTCGRGQCPQPPGCPPPHGGACSRLRRVGGAVTEGRDTFQVAHSS